MARSFVEDIAAVGRVTEERWIACSVKAHGGTLGVSSTAEESRFTFRIPLA
jgi:hypothetical protein